MFFAIKRRNNENRNLKYGRYHQLSRYFQVYMSTTEFETCEF